MSVSPTSVSISSISKTSGCRFAADQRTSVSLRAPSGPSFCKHSDRTLSTKSSCRTSRALEANLPSSACIARAVSSLAAWPASTLTYRQRYLPSALRRSWRASRIEVLPV